MTKHRTAVSRAYAWAFGDKNETSLSLYSGSRLEPQTAGAVLRNSRTFASARVGWGMGTGDAGFKDPLSSTEVPESITIATRWTRVNTFVLPPSRLGAQL